MTQEAPSLSGYWRIRHSTDPAMELVTLLEDLTDAGQELTGGMLDSVSWGETGSFTNSADPKRPRVQLDARPLKGCVAPLPADRVDVVLGEMLHEAGHTRWESQRVWQLMSGRLGDLGELAAVAKWFHNLCEDFHIDRRYAHESTSAGVYIRALRTYFDVPGASQGQVPILNDPNATDEQRFQALLQAIMGVALYHHKIPTGMPIEALHTMLAVLGSLKSLPVSASVEMRERRYAEAWGHFKAHPRPVPPPQPEPEPDDGESDETEEMDTPESGDDDGDTPTDDSEGEGEADETPNPESPGNDEKSEDDDDDADGGDESTPDDDGGDDEAAEDESPDASGDDESAPDESDESSDDETKPDEEGEENESGGDQDGDEETEPGDAPAPPALPWDVSDGAEGLDKATADKVTEYIRDHAEDLQAAVKALLGGGVEQQSFIMKDAQPDPDLESQVRRLAEPYYERIGRLFNQVRDSNYRNIRGVRSGRINQRRLWRGGMGRSDLFQRREQQHEPGLSLVLLLDQSSSMTNGPICPDCKGNPYLAYHAATNSYTKCEACFGNGRVPAYHGIVLPIATAIVNGLRQDVECWVASYTEDSTTDIRVLLRPAWGTALRLKIEDMGGTPSGVGLIAADELLKRAKYERRIVLHLTDGEPGYVGQIDGLTAVTAARQELERKGILCATLIIGDDETAAREDVQAAYGVLRSCSNMTDAGDAIESLLAELLRS